ncbi:recombinase family protein [Bacillus sp. CGMCC 1.16607]|uniref:recombinase family protein n=1 Tax=Bacillus sp. CGMCC 1.16607 TaxID=3351842 RepID=UPI00362525E3
MKPKAVFYLRVMDSSKVQGELALMNRQQISKEFIITDQPIVEVGGSYNKLVYMRREIKRLLHLVRTKKLNAVICKNLNNISRYPLEQIAIEKELLINNCRLISMGLATSAIDEVEELKWAVENFYYPRKEGDSC